MPDTIDRDAAAGFVTLTETWTALDPARRAEMDDVLLRERPAFAAEWIAGRAAPCSENDAEEKSLASSF